MCEIRCIFHLFNKYFCRKFSPLSYELSNIEWRLKPRQLKLEFAKFRDGRVLDNPDFNSHFKKYKNFDLATRIMAYRSITADFKDFFIKEHHRIKTAFNNNKIDNKPSVFKRYISTNYRGLLSLYDEAKTVKPPRVSFKSPDFNENYKKHTLRRINYLLQTQLIIPLKSFIEMEFADDLVINPRDSMHIPPAFSKPDSTMAANSKLQWKGNLNKLVTIFYELTNTHLHNGEPVIDASPQKIADFLFNNFLDKNAKELSKDTIRTILKPTRADKRSPDHKKYNIPS